MSRELWSAILNPSGPNFESWNEVMGAHRVPLQSAKSILVTLGEEKNVEVYQLDLSAMTLKQKARLLGFVARKFNTPVYEVEKEIAQRGFPIRAADVIVSFDMRALA